MSDHDGREPENWKDDLDEETREFVEEVLEPAEPSEKEGEAAEEVTGGD